MNNRQLDVICIGRSSVDLYGEQIGGRLEDTQSFAKYIGGCATNIAVGTSRLGLNSALITRVGDEQMGRFIYETLQEEGVDVSHVVTDPARLSALVILGIRDRQTFPHIFYRENCADMAIEAEDISPEFIASAKCIVVTGTHFSQSGVEAASRTAMKYAKDAGTKIVLDIDYRPVAWGLTAHGDGENRFIESAAITRHIQTFITDCDLIVGTEEEVHIAGGSTNTIQAVKRIRELSDAAIVVKRGPMGCVVFADKIPEHLNEGIWVKGNEVEVFNTLGAGDGFMSGFLRGWVYDESWETCCEYGNGSGAIVVSRHGCSPAIPSWIELQDFLTNGSPHKKLRDDKRLAHIHQATNRKKDWPEVCAIAFDHRSQFEDLLEGTSKTSAAITEFKDLIANGARDAIAEEESFGVLIDDKYGFDTLAKMSDNSCWIARPVELPGSYPLEFEGGDNIASILRDWPESHVVKCLVRYSPNDPAHIKASQNKSLKNLYQACLATNHELLLEVIPTEDNEHTRAETLGAMQEIYQLGINPQWWKICPPKNQQTWDNVEALIERNDKYCRGVIILGLNVALPELVEDFSLCLASPICKGFAVGRSIFLEAAEKWFRNEINDAQAQQLISNNYRLLLDTWAEVKTA